MFANAQSQTTIAYYNSETVWKKLKPCTFTKGAPLPEHSILLMSNRAVLDTGLRFMSIYPNKQLQLRYFIVAELGDLWCYQEVSNLKEGLSYFKLDTTWVIYNEGMGKVFTSNIYRALQMQKEYRVSVLMIDYPSIHTYKNPIRNYHFAVKNARHMYKYFDGAVDSFRQYISQVPQARTTLFMHSMGNYFLPKTILKSHYTALYRQPWLNNIVFNAPCVPAEHHNKWMGQIKASEHIWVHYNPNDRTLFYAHLAMMKRQLGEKVNKAVVPQVNYINFEPAVDTLHSNFFTLPGYPTLNVRIKKHYSLLLNGLQPDLNDTLNYIPSTYKSIGHAIRP